MALTFTVDEKDPKKIFLKGSINEDASPEQVFEKLHGDLVINLEQIERVNSIGIHKWIMAISAFTKSRKIIFEGLPYSLAVQARAVLNLFGTAKVVSIMSPYYCEKCEMHHLVMVTYSALKASLNHVPIAKCPKCLGEMEFDELPGYFDLLRTAGGG